MVFSSIFTLLSNPSSERDISNIWRLNDSSESSGSGTSKDLAITREEVIQKVQELVNQKYEGSFRKLFDAHASEEALDYKNMVFILKEANVGNTFSRPLVAQAILVQIDENEDGKLTWEEFDNAFEHGQFGSDEIDESIPIPEDEK